jgi:16S rRNA G966 N2-methylase RsmD
VDRDRRCVAVIKANLALLESEGAGLSRVDCAPVEPWLRRHQGRLAEYDLLMLDPPYGEPGLESVLLHLARPAALKADALVVLEERADREIVPAAGLEIVRRVSHGESALTLMRPA